MATTSKLLTAEEFMMLPADGQRQELVRGRIVEMPPPGWPHGRTVSKITRIVGSYAEDRGLGETASGDSGFVLERGPDTVLAPDFAFVSSERLRRFSGSEGYPDVAPDLVVEVVSPSDRMSDVMEKAASWLAFGARLVWIADPKHRAITVRRADGSSATIPPDGKVDGEDVLPGFSCEIRRFFE